MTSLWPDPTSRSARLHDRACHVLPGGNTRATVFFDPFPIYGAAGRGRSIIDVDGVERLDFINNYGSLIHGHAHPRIVERVIQQLGRGSALGVPTELEIELAELLNRRLPSCQKFRFTNSGSEAVMLAIRAARAYTGRFKIAKCEGAAHGGYDYVDVSRLPSPRKWGTERPVPLPDADGIPPAVLADVVVVPLNNSTVAEEILLECRDELAAIVLDPVQTDIGLVDLDPEFVAMLRRVTERHGILLIFDEVMSYRLGPGGAQGRLGVMPDLTVLGKIIGGGFPVGALGGRDEVMAVFDQRKGKPRLKHGGSFAANPITMIAGLTALQMLDDAAFVRLDAMGGNLRRALRQAFERTGCPGQVTGAGSFLQLHFKTETLRDYRSFVPGTAEVQSMSRLFAYLLSHGVFIAHWGLIALSTVMSDDDLANAAATIEAGLETLARDGRQARTEG